jgi:hypothetical protein
MEVTTHEDERVGRERRHVGSPEVARRHGPHSDGHGCHGERRGERGLRSRSGSCTWRKSVWIHGGRGKEVCLSHHGVRGATAWSGEWGSQPQLRRKSDVRWRSMWNEESMQSFFSSVIWPSLGLVGPQTRERGAARPDGTDARVLSLSKAKGLGERIKRGQIFTKMKEPTTNIGYWICEHCWNYPTLKLLLDCQNHGSNLFFLWITMV